MPHLSKFWTCINSAQRVPGWIHLYCFEHLLCVYFIEVAWHLLSEIAIIATVAYLLESDDYCEQHIKDIEQKCNKTEVQLVYNIKNDKDYRTSKCLYSC